MKRISNRSVARSDAGNSIPSRTAERFSLTAATAIVFGLLLLGGTSGCVFVNAPIEPFAHKPKPLTEHVVSGEGDARILVIDISRIITTESEETALGLRYKASVVARLEEELKRAGEDDSVRALVVRINSPGGTVTASDIAYRQLANFKTERQVPVVAQLMDVAASGGYYVALAADEIVAYPTTVTGSVGVVFHGISLEGLFEKIGVRNQTVKSGDKKDIGSPLRTMTAEERELLEGILGEMKDRFVNLVRERRPQLTREGESLISDGRILSAGQAKEIGLIDNVGTLEESIEAAKKLAGVTKAKVIMYRRPDEYAEGLYSSRTETPPAVSLINFDVGPLLRTPQFLYIWAPQAW
jgi:protease-4